MLVNQTVISSRNNPIVKWAASLKDKKGRDVSKSFIAEGEKLVFEVANSSLPVTHIFVCEDKAARLVPLVKERFSADLYRDTELYVLKPEAFEKISTENAPQGIISVVKHLDFFSESDIIYKEEFLKKSSERYIFLSSVRDPGNLGAVIRSSVAFGTDNIVLSTDCADVYNPKTIRGSMGSLFRVNISYVTSLEKTVMEARNSGRRVFAAELSEKAFSISDFDILPTDIIIIGNEGHGIIKSVSDACDGSLYIPISSKTESLNASVAAAVFMWEQSKK